MRRIVHHELGQPAQVLRVEEGPSVSLGPDQVRVRVSYAPIHPGDLLGVMGSPAFGTPPTIDADGRVPGFEGAGVVSEVGAGIAAGLGLRSGLRAAFFPAPGSWRDEVVVPAGSVVPLPDSIPDEIGAQMLINVATALTAIRAAHDSLPPDARTGVVVLLTGAGSAVGRLLGRLLTDRGVKVIRLVRSEAGPEKLSGFLPGSPIFATAVAGWKDRTRAAAEGAKIQTAIDSVGGRLLGDIAELLAEQTGTVINFGSLGGETSDIRLFPPRSLTLKGVFLGGWMQQPLDRRNADIALAKQLALEPGPLFEVAERYPPSRISNAVAHVSQAGRAGVVLYRFHERLGDRIMKFGTIGAGTVALAFARAALALGHEVVLSCRRGPESLAGKVAKLGRGAFEATVGEVASLDYVLLAVPWPNVEDALRGLPVWNGRVLIDATNPFIEYSPKLVLADLGGKGASEVVAGLAPGARVVKAFNSIVTERFNEGPIKNGGRRVIFVSGDHPEPIEFVKTVIESFGFVPVYLGDLTTGGRLQQAGGPLAGRDLVDFGSL